MATIIAGISAASAGISAGASLAGTTVLAMASSGGYSVACGIEVANWTKYLMEDPRTINDGGLVRVPPTDILPGVKEAMATHKSGGTATGTYGSVSWVVNDRRFVVMWSVPFNHDYHKNWLGVGITNPGHKDHDENWFDTMYYHSNTDVLQFKRKEFYTDSNPVTFSDGEYEIEGNMGSTHITEVHVTVKPCNDADLAPSIIEALE